MGSGSSPAGRWAPRSRGLTARAAGSGRRSMRRTAPAPWPSYGFNFQRYMVPCVKSASGEMDAARAFSQFDIDKDPPRLEELRQILDATDPDLDRKSVAQG